MIYIHTGKVTDSKYCTFGSACFYLADIPIRDIPYSFLLLRTLMLPLSCNAVSHPDPAGWCKRLCSGTVDAQRLPRLRRLLRKLSAIGCRVLDRICTRLYLTQIARRSANGYRAMQLRILARKCGVNACALARWTTAPFGLQSFASFWKFPYILSFAYIPSTQSLNAVNPRPGFPERGFCSLRKGLPSLNLLRCPPRMARPCSCRHTAPSAPTASPTQAFCYRLPGA